MKRMTITHTEYVGSAVSILAPDGRKDLYRVTNDGSGKYNTLIIYEPKDEIYEYWDAMYCWEEPEIKLPKITLDEFLSISVPPPLSSASILLKELRKDYAYKKDYPYSRPRKDFLFNALRR